MTYVVTVRGRLKHKTEQEARTAHDAVVEKLSVVGRAMGSTGHQAYLNSQDRSQFMATDYWDSLEAIQKFMGDPNTAAQIGPLFEGPPEVTVWVEAGWKGY